MDYIILLSVFLSPFLTLWLNETIKRSVQHSFNEKIEAVRGENNKKLAELVSELDSLKTKNNFKFVRLHEKRIEVLEETYKHINEIYYSLSSYVMPAKVVLPGAEERNLDQLALEQFQKSYRDFFTYFSRKKIYYDPEINNMIENFMSEIVKNSNKFSAYIFLRDNDFKGPDFGAAAKEAMECHQKISVEIKPIKLKIEEKFRDILEK